MKNLSIIAAIGKNHELGKNGNLVFDIKGDLKFFQTTTNGHDIIMGLTTWKSLPFKLKNRNHFILALPNEKIPMKSNSKDDIKTIDYAELVQDPTKNSKLSDQDYLKIIYDLNFFLKNYKPSTESFVIGGASIYKQFLPFAEKLYLTEVDATADADVFFPKFNHTNYQKTIIGTGSDQDLFYTHALYKKIK